MKITTLLETNTTPTTDPAGLQSQQAPKFGRNPHVLEDDEKLDETTAGAIATGEPTNMSMQRRGKGSMLQGIKTSKKFPNSEAVKEGHLYRPEQEDSPVSQAITRRILLQRTDLLAKYGPEKVGQAVDEVADFVGDVDEIGSSDVSGWIRHVEQMLGNMDQGVAEGLTQKYEMMMRNGQVKKFVAKDDADAKRIAAGHGAKSVIKLRGGVPAGKVAEQGVAEGPFTGIGKMMMKHKLKKGIKKDRDSEDDAFDNMHDYDFSNPDRFGHEDDFVKAHDAKRRKEKALDRLSREGVAEAGNKPLEKSRFGTGDTRTPRDIKSQMQGASDEFVKSTADKKTGPFHSKVAKMQGKLAKSELRRREQGVAEEKQRLDPSCWKGYKKQGTKMKGDTRVNNCVPVKEAEKYPEPEQEVIDATRRARLQREREPQGSDKIDTMLAQRNAQLQQYNETGKFWLKKKDSQEHVSNAYVGKAAANQAAIELLKQNPELKGNIVITAWGPGETPMNEAELSEEQILAKDLKKQLELFKKAVDNDLGSKPNDKELGKKPKDKEVQKK